MEQNNYRDKLFQNYRTTHARFVDIEGQEKAKWFLNYTQVNYLGHLKQYDHKSAIVLDIGCNQGYLLAAFASLGFSNLHGIDLSPVDIEKAHTVVPTAQLACVDAFDYLYDRKSQFDIITIKAVLEHIPKKDVIPLLESIEQALSPGGTLLIDVPNMDWLFAQHERYMDFTHEVGFTRESLAQVMRNVFADVRIFPGTSPSATTLKHRLAWWFRPLFLRFMNNLLKMVGEGAEDTWWHCRSIIGVARKP